MNSLRKSLFTTRHLRPDLRMNAWRKSINTLFEVMPPSQSIAEKGHNTVAGYLVNDQIMFSGCTTHAQRFERKALKIASDNMDHYAIQTHVSGQQEIHHGKKTITCRPGNVLVVDFADSYEATATDGSQRSIVIPRRLLSPHLTNPDSQARRVLNAESPLTRLLVNHVTTLFDLVGDMNEAEAAQVVQPTILLVAGVVNGSLAQVSDGRSAAKASLLAHAKSEIEKNLKRNITVDKLSAALNSSRATLYRLFEAEGGVRAYVQERRLRRSAEELLSAQGISMRICDIAYTWGFASEAHYSRAFRQRFGMTPREARARWLETSPFEEGMPPAEVGDRAYEQWLIKTLCL